ncbi:MBL fold metallo-hydrolase [Piscinibacter sakaiensis]|uniref:MBL fold metallo-hydrolase n=1 Tax=Piscinibacter sakaiensis TaxID=1547922 RepID=UPI003728BABE
MKTMHRAAAALVALAGLTVAACGGDGGEMAATAAPQAPAIQPTNFELQMEASRLNTGGDPRMVHPWRAFYCNLSDDNNAIVLAERQRNSIRMPLTQILDDVWYIGTEYVGQYVLRNEQGLVMIDAGNSAAEMNNFNLPALRSLGLGTGMPLHAVLVTHGHGDHDGGAAELKSATGAPIYLGSADASGKAYAPTALDSSVLTPYDIQVGGRTITVLSTPGHTAGATGFVVRAKDGGKEVRLFVSGGSSLVANNPGLVRAYLASMESTYAMLKALKVDTASNPHTYWDGSRDLIKRIQSEGLKSPSQFVIGNQALLRAMAIGRTCTAAYLAKQDPTAAPSVWRVSELDFLPASPAPGRVAARLSNGWGPVAGQTVSFKLDSGALLCSAVTGADGTATCASTSAPLRAGVDRVTAEFAGASTAAVVDLPSEAAAASAPPTARSTGTR